MSSTFPASTSAPNAQPPAALQRIRACLPALARHGRSVAAFSAVIGLVLWLARSDQRLDVQLVYSFSTGLVSWLLRSEERRVGKEC